jgi:hypothetical protein
MIDQEWWIAVAEKFGDDGLPEISMDDGLSKVARCKISTQMAIVC